MLGVFVAGGIVLQENHHLYGHMQCIFTYSANTRPVTQLSRLIIGRVVHAQQLPTT
jgi:hypothetical protein